MKAVNVPVEPPRKILVIALRYLGDVLLVTPLLRSLRLAYPAAQLDVLVYQATAGMLEGNPDVSAIITQDAKPKGRQLWVLLKTLFRRYDLAISTQVGDRPIVYTLLAAPFRIAPVPPKGEKGWWKRVLLQCWVAFDDDNTHTVLQHLKLLECLGIPKHYALIPPSSDIFPQAMDSLQKSAFVVMHVYPQWVYKRWTEAGWVALGRYFHAHGFRVVLTGGPVPEELAYVDSIVRQLPDDTLNLAGRLSLALLTSVLAKAKLFVGPDTGITHLAAATGVPVVALFGPTNPVKWAPWPYAYRSNVNPFERVGSKQVNNVYFVQGEAECVPCHLEGCDRHRQSRSLCLDHLSLQRVQKVVNHMLALE